VVGVEVVPYDPAWPDRATALITGLREVLGPRALRIEHIGSTAIAGMAAKDVIDLQVSVADLESAARDFDAPLGAQGFQRVPYEHDHVPAGLEDDPARWVKRLWSRRAHAGGDVNLHVRLAGSPNERVALLFRDWLRAHPAAVPAYSAFKRDLAAAVADLDAYTDVKDPVVDLVIAAAETWATETGWRA
jgi:dephospho-CoA kinase